MNDKTVILFTQATPSSPFLLPSLIFFRTNSGDYSLFYKLNAEVIYIMWSIVDYSAFYSDAPVGNNLAHFQYFGSVHNARMNTHAQMF